MNNGIVYSMNSVIPIGYVGENETREIAIDIRPLIRAWPDLAPVLLAKRPGETALYPCVTRVENGVLYWRVTLSDTAIPGKGECVIHMIDGEGRVGKSRTMTTLIERSASGEETQEPPEAIKPWIDDVLASIESVKEGYIEIEQGEENAGLVLAVGEDGRVTLKKGGTGGDGVGVESVEQTQESVESGGENVWTLRLTDGTTSRLIVRNGARGAQGERGERGIQGERGQSGEAGPAGPQGPAGETGPAGPQGERGPAGERGEQGERGAPFAIAKIYSSIANMNAGYASDGVAVGGFVLIETGDVNDEENARLYVKGESRYEYVTDLSGAQGIQGPEGIQGERGPTGAAGADGPKGEQGPKGDAGPQGIQGPEGPQGIQGEKGEKGDKGDTGAQGPKGDKGDTGPKGSDATVTPESIQAALGYEPASKEDIGQIALPPAYWLDALNAGVEAINTALCGAGKNKSAFLFYSDAHWNYGSQMSPKLLKYLYEHTGMTKTFFGGDIVNAEGYDYEIMSYLWGWRSQLKGLPNHHSVVGNHDDGGDTAVQFDSKYVYGYLLAPEETCDIVYGKGLYYYIDNPAEKTRYLYLDTGFEGYSSLSADQEAFIRESLKTTAAGWHIAVVAHVWYQPDYDQYNVTPIPIKGLSSTASAVAAILDAYNNRTGEFSGCSAWVEFCVGGHVHRDYDGATPNGIPIILVETDSCHTRSGLSCVTGTTTEASVNGIIADYDAKVIKVVRVGRGASREVEITWHEVSYTNVLPLAVAADGKTIYNGVGYKAGVRWSSSGNTESTSNAENLYLSGYIPLKKGDAVYLENVTMNKANSNTNGCAIHLFASLTDTNEATRTGDMITNYMSGIWDKSGNLIQCTLGPDDNFAYIRLQGTYMGPDSIVTINEPID